MLFSLYTEKISALSASSLQLSVAQIALLRKLQSKTMFKELMDALPKDWEKSFKIVFYDSPEKVNQKFQNFIKYKGNKVVHEVIVSSIIASKLEETIPAKYDEYLKRDYDYPIEEDKWKINQDLTYFTPSSFHLDHKLIWLSKEREIPMSSNDTIESVDYKYTINVYVPNPDIVIDVENLKLNGVV